MTGLSALASACKNETFYRKMTVVRVTAYVWLLSMQCF
jgi:hypothetical protein